MLTADGFTDSYPWEGEMSVQSLNRLQGLPLTETGTRCHVMTIFILVPAKTRNRVGAHCVNSNVIKCRANGSMCDLC